MKPSVNLTLFFFSCLRLTADVTRRTRDRVAVDQYPPAFHFHRHELGTSRSRCARLTAMCHTSLTPARLQTLISCLARLKAQRSVARFRNFLKKNSKRIRSGRGPCNQPVPPPRSFYFYPDPVYLELACAHCAAHRSIGNLTCDSWQTRFRIPSSGCDREISHIQKSPQIVTFEPRRCVAVSCNLSSSLSRAKPGHRVRLARTQLHALPLRHLAMVMDAPRTVHLNFL
jgi:hypothetical protein